MMFSLILATAFAVATVEPEPFSDESLNAQAIRMSARMTPGPADFQDFSSFKGTGIPKDRESFWSIQNVTLHAANIGGGIYDMRSTYRCLAAPPAYLVETSPDGHQRLVKYTCVEGNPLYRWVLPKGDLATYTLKTVTVEVAVVGGYYARRSKNPFIRYGLGWGVPIGFVVAQVRAGHNNDTIRHNLEQGRRP